MKTLFTIHAFVSWVFGLALLLVPVALVASYGITIDLGGTILARLLGGALVGLGVMAWFARSTVPSEALRGIILGDTIISVVGCLISIHGVLSSVSNALGWVNVILFGFFAIGFGALATGKAPTRKAVTAH